MKILQEIEILLASENATFEVNKYCKLHRFKRDCFGNSVDEFQAVFNIVDGFCSIYEIKNRKPRDIVRELARCQSYAFSLATSSLNEKFLEELK